VQLGCSNGAAGSGLLCGGWRIAGLGLFQSAGTGLLLLPFSFVTFLLGIQKKSKTHE
jgi:hypothetical protein